MIFENEENFSFIPPCILEIMMMTSLLADKSFKIEIKTLLNFMNEIINPPWNSLLATFFEAIREACLKTVSSSLRKLTRPKRTINQLFKLLFPLPLLSSPKKMSLERGEESPAGCPDGPIEVGGVCEIEVGTEADLEDEDEDVDVVGGVDEVGVSGYESEGFTLSEILRRKTLEKNVSESVFDTAHLPQCEFSNLHQLALALFLEFFCWRGIEFGWASYAARAGT